MVHRLHGEQNTLLEASINVRASICASSSMEREPPFGHRQSRH